MPIISVELVEVEKDWELSWRVSEVQVTLDACDLQEICLGSGLVLNEQCRRPIEFSDFRSHQ